MTKRKKDKMTKGQRTKREFDIVTSGQFCTLAMFFWGYLRRVADVEEPHNRRCTKGQGFLRKDGPPTYDILSQKYVLSRFTRFLKGHHRAFYESHPALGVFSTSVSLLLKGFQQKSAYFRRAFGEPVFGELS